MIWKYINRYKIRYFIGIVILFMVDFFSVYIPQFTGEITDGLGNGTMDRNGVMHFVMLIFFAGVGMALGRFGWRYFIFGSARKIEREIRDDLFDHLSTLSADYYNHNKTGDLMSYFTNDISTLRSAIGPAVISSFDAIVMTVMVIVKMIMFVNLRLTLLACIPMIFILAGAVYFINVADKYYEEKNAAFSKMSDHVQESVSGIRVIKAFVQERKDLIEFSKVNRNSFDKNMRVVKLVTIIWPTLDFIVGVSAAINLIYGGYLVTAGKLSLGQFVAFNQYIGMLVWPMIAAGDSINSFSQGKAASGRLKKLFEERPDIVDTGKNSGITDLKGEIEVNNLTFSYLPVGCVKEDATVSSEDGEQNRTPINVLSNVSVKIPAGSTLAIIGRTGCGKTTFANLLLRVYETEKGMIRYDGHDLQDIPLDVLRSRIAYVPQDNFLFSDTVQANIAFGTRDRSGLKPEKFSMEALTKSEKELAHYLDEVEADSYAKRDLEFNDLEAVEEAAKLAAVHDNIIEFPKKYGTLVGERGVTMSGGQKQRSSIARALMKEAPVLILDDALSAVDTDTEEQILENLKKDRAGLTTIIIAHRISTIQNADKIMVLDEGKVAEYGSHDELVALGGRYAKLYEKQQLEKMLDEAE